VNIEMETVLCCVIPYKIILTAEAKNFKSNNSYESNCAYFPEMPYIILYQVILVNHSNETSEDYFHTLMPLFHFFTIEI